MTLRLNECDQLPLSVSSDYSRLWLVIFLFQHIVEFLISPQHVHHPVDQLPRLSNLQVDDGQKLLHLSIADILILETIAHVLDF